MQSKSILLIGGVAVLALAVSVAGYLNANRHASANGPGVAAASSGPPSAPASEAATRPTMSRIIAAPPGTRIAVRLDEAVSSRSNIGTPLTATVTEPVVVDGETVIPRGARGTVRVVETKRSGRLKGRAHISLALDSVHSGNASHRLDTSLYAVQGKRHRKHNLLWIGGTAGTGALIGGLAGGPVGALIGTGAGAGAGTTVAAVTGRRDLVIPAETKLHFVLREQVQFTVWK